MEHPAHATDAIGLITIIIQLIFLEGILSIDNAAVLGAMVSVLPSDKPVPYPGPFKFLLPFTNRKFWERLTSSN
jgi:tellurite resistance protein TerC